MKKFLFWFVLMLLVGSTLGYLLVKRIYSPKVENFLLITIDTLRADHLGCYGYRRPTSPFLDQFARESTVFENAFCVMPTTIPSHGSIFYSTWPRIHGSTSNFQLFSNQNITFLPDLLKRNGYRIGAFSAIKGLAGALGRNASFADIHVPHERADAQEMLDAAREWLSKKGAGKFFLWIHLWDPHSPYQPHPQFLKKLGSKSDYRFRQHFEFLRKPYTAEQIKAMMELYDNEIAYMDDHLGKFLNEFRAEFGNNTMIIVTSDHGETLDELIESEGYAFDHGEFLYDHQIHIPMMVRFPGISGGKRVSTTVTLLDVFPTIFDEAGIPLPASAHGVSLLPLIKGKGRAESLVLLQRHDFDSPPRPFLAQREYGIRARNYKLLWDEKDNVTRLYRNGQEGRDMSSTNQPLTKQLREKLSQWLITTAQFAGEEKKTVSPEEAEKIRALGYVQ